MIHTISGNNFHGGYSVRARGPASGFVMSAKQARKVSRALCDYEGCQCGGGYGTGPDAGSARMVQVDYDKFELIPASAVARRDAEDARLMEAGAQAWCGAK